MILGSRSRKGDKLNIHVGNLAREVTEEGLRQVFEPFGKVAAVRIIMDRHSGVSRGFAFVEMGDQAEAQAAVHALHRRELAGRTLDVSEAHPPHEGTRNSRFHVGGRGSRPRREVAGSWLAQHRRRPF